MYKNCLFCRIARGRESNVLFYKDSEVVVFEDIRPAAEYHYLAIPTQHIPYCTNLTSKHIGLLKKLKKAGETVLNAHIVKKSKCISGLLATESGPETFPVPISPVHTIFGFHFPPHNSQDHLHMHIVAPADKLSIGSIDRVLGINCFRFISYDEQLKELEKPSTEPGGCSLIRKRRRDRDDDEPTNTDCPSTKKYRRDLVKSCGCSPRSVTSSRRT